MHIKQPIRRLIAALSITACAVSAQATSINLGSYQLTGSYTLDTLGGVGLEASAVTYARDRGSLFFVGDEGLGVVEISLTGQTLGSMNFNWSGTGSSNNDAEGLTYLGGGELVVVDERPQMAYKFTYNSGSTLVLNDQPKVAITGNSASVGNVGTEGISYDPLSGTYYSVKQDSPVEVRQASLNFAVGGGTSSSTTLASGATSLFGLNSLSDVQALSTVDFLTGTDAATHLLLLSLDSKMLVEFDPVTSTVLSMYDLSGLTTQAIEGVTVDENGVIYLVAESSGAAPSQLFTLAASPVPLPAAAWLLLSGLGMLAPIARRRS